MIRVAFRVDASVQMGTGHFMRCLTLADALKKNGVRIRFVSRCLPVYLRDMVAAKGMEFTALKSEVPVTQVGDLAHSHWLGTSQVQDGQDTVEVLADQTWDWLVVDHYALDVRWEQLLRKTAKKIMVIDDLADRRHDSDLLLDQNLVTDFESRYDKLSPDTCKRLLGSRYALLREEFSAHRYLALARRDKMEKVERLLVSLGGTDPDNVTVTVLEGIEQAGFDGHIDVVVGSDAPYLDAVKTQAARMTSAVKLHVATQNMAELMTRADLAVGAGGITSWERCAMGLPSIIIITAKNQKPIVAELVRIGVARCLGTTIEVDSHRLATELCYLVKQVEVLRAMSRLASFVCEGNGVGRVVQNMIV